MKNRNIRIRHECGRKILRDRTTSSLGTECDILYADEIRTGGRNINMGDMSMLMIRYAYGVTAEVESKNLNSNRKQQGY